MAPNGWVGRTIGGRYRIEELLGQGGMSAVYRASDPNLRRTVAVKIIHAHLADSEFVRRFEEEAAAVAQLRHSNIIQVYDFDHDNGTYYMVMEYVPGETLQSRLARLHATGQRLPYADIVRYAIHTCEAVDYAHKRGMIHRDIKPANIMLDLNGEAILMDFGIAKIVGGQQHTATGAVVGTALYMSPEQIRSERFDHRTDIYSLGVTLFEMVHGRPPFTADSTMALMMLHLNEPIPDLRQLHPDAPEDLVRLIEKAMSKEPGGRFLSATEMAAALRKVLAALQSPATAGETSSRVQVYAPTGAQAVARPALAAVGAAAAPGQAVVVDAPVQPPGVWGLSRRGLLTGGCAAILLAVVCFLGGSTLLVNQLVPGGVGRNAQGAFVATQTSVAGTRQALDTSAPLPSQSPFQSAADTALPATEGVATPASAGPTPNPAENPAVVIISVVEAGAVYRVEYETVGFLEAAGGKHIHFFYNNISPEDAGFPGPGPWFMHPGPRPFLGATISDRPPDATQMCALVADATHRAYPNSGNCVDLPGVATPAPAP